MAHIVSVWLPHWPIERLRRETGKRFCARGLDERPFALIGTGEKGLRLTAVNAPAERESLLPGLGLADARARCPRLLTTPAEPGKDAAALLRLAHWCTRYSPSFNVDGASGLWIDATGASHLFGGLSALALDLETRLARFGFTACIGLGSTLGAAWARARFAPLQQDARLAGLPVEGLRLSPETLALLKRLGLRRIGDLERLPRPALKRRFPSRDVAEAVLGRLDEAFGRRDEPLAPLAPPSRYVARRVFLEPLISSAAVEAALEGLAQDLAARLARALKGAREVALTLYRADGTWAQVRASFSAPCRASNHFSRLLGEKIEHLDAGFGIDCLTLAATISETLEAEQENLVTENKRTSPERLIDRLANRLSAAGVFVLEPRESHIPERAQGRRTALGARSRWAGARPLTPPRPPFMLVHPEAISVIAEVPEGPPIRFTWRRLTRRVIRAQGPERIAPEWWRAVTAGHNEGMSKGREVVESRDRKQRHPRPRDYYRIEDEAGARYWVFREGLYQSQAHAGPPQWYLHGLFE
jgi:protein ImuB